VSTYAFEPHIPVAPYISVDDAAAALGVTPMTVRNLIYEGWLQAKCEVKQRKMNKKKIRKKWLVSTKSVFQYQFATSLTRKEIITYRRWKLRRRKKSKFSAKDRIANCSCSSERQGCVDNAAATPPPTPSLKGRGTGAAPSGSEPPQTPPAEPSEQIEPREAAVRFQFSFGLYARRLAPFDAALRDDLVQEMSLAVLQAPNAGSRGYFLQRAWWRALNYVEYERVRGMTGLEEIEQRKERRDGVWLAFEEKMREIVERGIPYEWIEEILLVWLGAAG